MPTISMFYGIIIRMYSRNEHNPPHFHAHYSGFEAIFDLEGEITEGKFPKKQTRLVQAWCELHKDELEANWQLALNNEVVFAIEPLK